MQLGKTIAELRKERGIKQKALAEKCGVSPAYLSQIENDRRDPTLSVLESIGRNLKIPLPFLFFLASDESDIPEGKKEAYSLLVPSMNSLIRSLLNDSKINHSSAT